MYTMSKVLSTLTMFGCFQIANTEDNLFPRQMLEKEVLKEQHKSWIQYIKKHKSNIVQSIFSHKWSKVKQFVDVVKTMQIKSFIYKMSARKSWAFKITKTGNSTREIFSVEGQTYLQIIYAKFGKSWHYLNKSVDSFDTKIDLNNLESISTQNSLESPVGEISFSGYVRGRAYNQDLFWKLDAFLSLNISFSKIHFSSYMLKNCFVDRLWLKSDANNLTLCGTHSAVILYLRQNVQFDIWARLETSYEIDMYFSVVDKGYIETLRYHATPMLGDGEHSIESKTWTTSFPWKKKFVSNYRIEVQPFEKITFVISHYFYKHSLFDGPGSLSPEIVNPDKRTDSWTSYNTTGFLGTILIEHTFFEDQFKQTNMSYFASAREFYTWQLPSVGLHHNKNNHKCLNKSACVLLYSHLRQTSWDMLKVTTVKLKSQVFNRIPSFSCLYSGLLYIGLDFEKGQYCESFEGKHMFRPFYTSQHVVYIIIYFYSPYATLDDMIFEISVDNCKYMKMKICLQTIELKMTLQYRCLIVQLFHFGKRQHDEAPETSLLENYHFEACVFALLARTMEGRMMHWNITGFLRAYTNNLFSAGQFSVARQRKNNNNNNNNNNNEF